MPNTPSNVPEREKLPAVPAIGDHHGAFMGTGEFVKKVALPFAAMAVVGVGVATYDHFHPSSKKEADTVPAARANTVSDVQNTVRERIDSVATDRESSSVERTQTFD